MSRRRESRLDYESLALPKHKRLELEIEERIRSGTYRPGERLPSEKQLMATTGYSCTTVSRAMRALADAGLISRSRKRGSFVADKLPRVPTRSRSLLYFHRWLPEGFHPYTTGLLQGLVRGASDAGTDLKLFAAPDAAVPLDRAFLQQHDVAGVVATQLRREELDMALSQQLPIVLVSSWWHDSPMTRVVSDAAHGIRTALKHLRRLGHEHIALVLHHLTRVWVETAAEVLGCAPDTMPLPAVSVHDWTAAAAAQGVEQLLALTPRPTAVLVHDDFVMRHFWFALRNAGVQIPESLAVVGFGTPYSQAFVGAPISMIETDVEAIGQQAITILQRKIQGHAVTENVIRMRPRLVVRDSCGGQRRSRTHASRR